MSRQRTLNALFGSVLELVSHSGLPSQESGERFKEILAQLVILEYKHSKAYFQSETTTPQKS